MMISPVLPWPAAGHLCQLLGLSIVEELLSKNITRCSFCCLLLVIGALFERGAFVSYSREERERGIMGIQVKHRK